MHYIYNIISLKKNVLCMMSYCLMLTLMYKKIITKCVQIHLNLVIIELFKQV